MNTVVLMGRLTKNPELRQTQSGTDVTQFTIAVNRRYKDANGEYPTDFINCVAWRQTAGFISKYFAKGAMIAVAGTLQTRKYTDKQGAERTATEVVVDNAEFTGEKKERDIFDDYSDVEDDGSLPF